MQTTGWPLVLALTAASVAAAPAPGAPAWAAQAGDKEDEAQPMVDRRFEVPPAPALDVDAARASFTLPAGYTIEAVAADPLIHDPVDIAFDARGRLWVVEMTTLMKDPDATGELEPANSIAVLDDRDGDGVYDTRTNFVEDVVLPRSICFVDGGVLAILPPRIVFLRDTDGDGRADEEELVDDGIRAGLSNPEHAANGLTLGMDNWVYLANHDRRYRRVDGEWRSEGVPQVGQWGLGQDAWGRRVYNYNSAPVHGDLVPTHYLVGNPAQGRAQGVNARWAHDTRVWPGRVNPGVNRGYRGGTLADDGRLARYTAACGPEVFLGTRLAPEDRGDIFVCEPSGNLLRQLRMHERDARPRGENAYAAANGEFLTSTDERFRPVNLANGPDGALYVVDLYRGILQHRVFMTSFLRRQIEERGLAEPVGLGRVWRIAHGEHDRGPRAFPDLTQRSELELVSALADAHAWIRRTAQRLLVERGPTARTLRAEDAEGTASCLALEALASDPDVPAVTRAHALWTLEGRGTLRRDFVLQRLAAEDHPRVLAQAIRLAEAWSGDFAVRESWQRLLDHEARPVRWQLAHSLGVCAHPSALDQLLQLVIRHADDAILRTGAWAGLAGRETQVLERVLVHPWLRRDDDTRGLLTRDLARLIARRAEAAPLTAVLQRAGTARHAWTAAAGSGREAAARRARADAHALLTGLRDGLPDRTGDRRYQFTAAEPAALAALCEDEDETLAQTAAAIRARTGWSAEAAAEPALAPAHAAALARGAEVYAVACGTCHQADGRGLDGLAPPFVGSEWLDKPDAELADIALYGLSGPIEVAGERWDMTMPGWAQLSDRELADVLTYVTTRWAREPRQVAPELIASRRNASR